MVDGELSAGILALAGRAEACLGLASVLVRDRRRHSDENGVSLSQWSLFLEDKPHPESIETCAVSIGGLSLLATGESCDSAAVLGAANQIARLQRADGGWTSFSANEEEESLTIEAFFALGLLIGIGNKAYSPQIVAGIQWLMATQNDDGGWGFFAESPSQVVTTSYAVRTLAEWLASNRSDLPARDAVHRGLAWLLARRNGEGSWSQLQGQPPSAVQTALALLALSAAGMFSKHSKEVTESRNWLESNIADRTAVVDNYQVPKRAADGKIMGFARRISHTNYAPGVILQALLSSGVDILDERLTSLVRYLADSQVASGSWKCEGVAYDAPVYAILDACLGLQRFSLEIKRSEGTLEVREAVLGLERRVAGLEVMHKEMLRRDAEMALGDRVAAVESALQDARSRLAILEDGLTQAGSRLEEVREKANSLRLDLGPMQRFRSGLFWLVPLARLGNLVRRYPRYSALVCVLVGYALVRLIVNVGNRTWDLVTALVSAILILLNERAGRPKDGTAS